MDGYTVTPSILVPANATNLTISQTGVVDRHAARPGDAAAARPADDRQFRQRRRPPGARRQLFPADRGLGPADGRRSRRHRLRRTPAGLYRGLQRRSGDRDHQSDRGPARLRDELQGDPGGRPDVRHDLQHAQLGKGSCASSSSAEFAIATLLLARSRPRLGARAAAGRADADRRHLSGRHHPRRYADGQPGRRHPRRRRPLRRRSRARRRKNRAADPAARPRDPILRASPIASSSPTAPR